MDAAWQTQLDAAAQALAAADTLFVFTGSGMSAESGLPTFRGPGGLWEGVAPEAVATPDAFRRDPAFVWRWYRERLARHGAAKPHAGHKALAKLQGMYGRFTLATQNVDALHEAAGNRGVIHLHGTMGHARCTACGKREELRAKMLRNLPPRCATCAGLLRPDVVWFGEALPRAAMEESTAAAANADAALAVGTSSLVFPAAGLPLLAKEHGAFLVEVNPAETPLSPLADVRLPDTAASVLRSLVDQVSILRRRTRSKT